MGFYGNLAKEETEVIELEIYTECDTMEDEFLIEAYINASIINKKEKANFKLHIRNKNSAGRGISSVSKHPLTVKVFDKTDKGEKVPIEKIGDKYDFSDNVSSETRNRLNKEKYIKDAKEFISDNYDIIDKMWNCKSDDEFYLLADELQSSSKYKISYNKR